MRILNSTLAFINSGGQKQHPCAAIGEKHNIERNKNLEGHSDIELQMITIT